jgi:hypothetical protein
LGEAHGGSSQRKPLTMEDVSHLDAVYRVLLLAQLWDLLPWQVKQLQEADDRGCDAVATATAAAAAAPATAPYASSQCAADVSSESAYSSSSRGGSSSGASSGGRGGTGGRGADAWWSSSSGYVSGGAYRIVGPWLPGHFIEWPSRPPHDWGVSTAGDACTGPVTLKQLQLAVSALACAPGTWACSPALLLALLLQRADPGLRAEFLGGPGGTALLAAAQYWGNFSSRSPTGVWKQPTLVLIGSHKMNPGDCYRRLLALLQQASDGRPGVMTGFLAPHSFALVLAWCYLQPYPGWEEQMSPADLQQFAGLHTIVSTGHACLTAAQGGEGITGEWVVARFIHEAGARWCQELPHRPWNMGVCAMLPSARPLSNTSAHVQEKWLCGLTVAGMQCHQ